MDKLEEIRLATPTAARYSPPPTWVAGTGAPLQMKLWQRVGLALIAAVVATLLVIAGSLTPNGDGFGTHQQLGLPPCSIVQWFGIRCPACGMTTAWSCVVRGWWWQGFEANVGGTLLALLAIVLVPWSSLAAVRGRWWPTLPREIWGWTVAAVIVIVTWLDWLLRHAFG